MEGTFGDSWKYFNHGIGPVFLVHVGKSYYVSAVVHERSAKEFVSKNYIYYLKIEKKKHEQKLLALSLDL